ncbi:uncharacterized protein [Littorina saxatilis]
MLPFSNNSHAHCDSSQSAHPHHAQPAPGILEDTHHHHHHHPELMLTQEQRIWSSSEQNCYHHHLHSELDDQQDSETNVFAQTETHSSCHHHLLDHEMSKPQQIGSPLLGSLSITSQENRSSSETGESLYEPELQHDPSIPLDVLELVRRLKAVAKERMIEEAVSKLMGCKAENTQMGDNEDSSMEDHSDCLHLSASCGTGAQVKEEQECEVGTEPERHSVLEHTHYWPASNDPELEFELRACGLDCKPVIMKPVKLEENRSYHFSGFHTQQSSSDAHQAETDVDMPMELSPIPLPTSCKCEPNILSEPDHQPSFTASGAADQPFKSFKRVRPVKLKRKAGSTRKFKVVMDPYCSDFVAHDSSSAEEQAKQKRKKLKIIRKPKKTHFSCKAFKLKKQTSPRMTVVEQRIKSKKSIHGKLDRIGEKEELSQFNTMPGNHHWQGSELTNVQVMMMLKANLADNSESGRGCPALASSDLDAGELSDISCPGVLVGDQDLFDSDTLVEQIDQLLSGGNSPTQIEAGCVGTTNQKKQEVANGPVSTGQVHLGDPLPKMVTQVVMKPEDSGTTGYCEAGFSSSTKGKSVSHGKKAVKKTKSAGVSESGHSDSKVAPFCEEKILSGTAYSHPKSIKPASGEFHSKKESPKTVFTKYQVKALQRFQNVHAHLLKPCSVTVHHLSKTGLQFDSQGSCKIKNVKNLTVPCSKGAALTTHARKHEDKGKKTSAKASEKSKSSAISSRASDSRSLGDKSDDSPLGRSQPLEGQNPHTANAIITTDPEADLSGGTKHADSKQLGSDSQRQQTSPAKAKHQLPFKKKDTSTSSSNSASRHSKQVKPVGPAKLSKVHPSSQKKHRIAVVKGKTKASAKSSSLGQAKRPILQHSHSWDDVLQEMTMLSGSSCSSKTTAEPSKLSLPRIPKRNKPSNSGAVGTSRKSSSGVTTDSKNREPETKRPTFSHPLPNVSSSKLLEQTLPEKVRPVHPDQKAHTDAVSVNNSEALAVGSSGGVPKIPTLFTPIRMVSESRKNPISVTQELPGKGLSPISYYSANSDSSSTVLPQQSNDWQDLSTSPMMNAPHLTQHIALMQQAIQSVTLSLTNEQTASSAVFTGPEPWSLTHPQTHSSPSVPSRDTRKRQVMTCTEDAGVAQPIQSTALSAELEASSFQVSCVPVETVDAAGKCETQVADESPAKSETFRLDFSQSQKNAALKASKGTKHSHGLAASELPQMSPRNIEQLTEHAQLSGEHSMGTPELHSQQNFELAEEALQENPVEPVKGHEGDRVFDKAGDTKSGEKTPEHVAETTSNEGNIELMVDLCEWNQLMSTHETKDDEMLNKNSLPKLPQDQKLITSTLHGFHADEEEGNHKSTDGATTTDHDEKRHGPATLPYLCQEQRYKPANPMYLSQEKRYGTHLSDVKRYGPATPSCLGQEKRFGPAILSKLSDHKKHEKSFDTGTANDFAVLDECGYSDTSANLSVSDVIFHHLNLESKFAKEKARMSASSGQLLTLKSAEEKTVKTANPGHPLTGKREAPKEDTVDLSESMLDSSKGTKAPSSKTCQKSRPHIAPNFYSFFAHTMVKVHESNKKIDLELRKRQAGRGSSQRSRSPSMCRQGGGSRSPRRRNRSRSPSVRSRRGSRSPHALKRVRSKTPGQRSRSPSEQPIGARSRTKLRSKSPSFKKQRSRSPDGRRGRSRSPSASSTMSRANSPSRREDYGREEKMLPARGRDRGQVTEDRHRRQYQPYGDRQTRGNERDQRRRGKTWDRWNRRWEEDKPIADFELAYKELGELLTDKTSMTFHNRLSEERKKPAALFKDRCYKGKRFAGYCFRRSRIPTLDEFQLLAEIEGRNVMKKPASDAEEEPENEEEEDNKERSMLADTLDKVLGETEEPCPEGGMERNLIEDLRVKSGNPLFASSFIGDEVRGSPLPSFGSMSPSKHLHAETCSHTSNEPGESLSSDSVRTASDTRRVVSSQSVDEEFGRKSISQLSVVQALFPDSDHSSEHRRKIVLKRHSRLKSKLVEESGQQRLPLSDHSQVGRRHQRSSSEPGLDESNTFEAKSRSQQGRSRHWSAASTQLKHMLPRGPQTPPEPCPVYLSPDVLRCLQPGSRQNCWGSRQRSCGPHTPPEPSPGLDLENTRSRGLTVCSPGLRDPRLSVQHGCVGPTTPPLSCTDSDSSMKANDNMSSRVYQDSRTGRLVILKRAGRMSVSPSDRSPKAGSITELPSCSLASLKLRKGTASLEEDAVKLKTVGEPQPRIAADKDAEYGPNTVLKIINTAKRTAAVKQSYQPLVDSVFSSATSYMITNLTKTVASHPRLLSLNSGPAPPSQLTVTTASIPGQSAPTKTGQSSSTVTSEQPVAIKNATQSMEKLVHQLKVLIAQKAGQTSSDAATKPSLAQDKPQVPQSSAAPAPRRKKKREISKAPWVLHYWPGRPVPITLVERIPDYQPNPSLADERHVLHIDKDGPDPRLDPDRPSFVPGGKSEQAKALTLKEKKRFFSCIKVVKEIPLEPVMPEGRSLPKDPRHPFRSVVADMDELGHTEKNDSEERINMAAEVDNLEGKRATEKRQKQARVEKVTDGSEKQILSDQEAEAALSGHTASEASAAGEEKSVKVVLELEEERGLSTVPLTTSVRSSESDDIGSDASGKVFSKAIDIIIDEQEVASDTPGSTLVRNAKTESEKSTSGDDSKETTCLRLELTGKLCPDTGELVQDKNTHASEDDPCGTVSDMDITPEVVESMSKKAEGIGTDGGARENPESEHEESRETATLDPMQNPPFCSSMDNSLSHQQDALNEELFNDVMIMGSGGSDESNREDTEAEECAPVKAGTSQPPVSKPIIFPSFREMLGTSSEDLSAAGLHGSPEKLSKGKSGAPLVSRSIECVLEAISQNPPFCSSMDNSLSHQWDALNEELFNDVMIMGSGGSDESNREDTEVEECAPVKAGTSQPPVSKPIILPSFREMLGTSSEDLSAAGLHGSSEKLSQGKSGTPLVSRSIESVLEAISPRKHSRQKQSSSQSLLNPTEDGCKAGETADVDSAKGPSEETVRLSPAPLNFERENEADQTQEPTEQIAHSNQANLNSEQVDRETIHGAEQVSESAKQIVLPGQEQKKEDSLVTIQKAGQVKEATEQNDITSETANHTEHKKGHVEVDPDTNQTQEATSHSVLPEDDMYSSEREEKDFQNTHEAEPLQGDSPQKATEQTDLTSPAVLNVSQGEVDLAIQQEAKEMQEPLTHEAVEQSTVSEPAVLNHDRDDLCVVQEAKQMQEQLTRKGAEQGTLPTALNPDHCDSLVGQEAKEWQDTNTQTALTHSATLNSDIQKENQEAVLETAEQRSWTRPAALNLKQDGSDQRVIRESPVQETDSRVVVLCHTPLSAGLVNYSLSSTSDTSFEYNCSISFTNDQISDNHKDMQVFTEAAAESTSFDKAQNEREASHTLTDSPDHVRTLAAPLKGSADRKPASSDCHLVIETAQSKSAPETRIPTVISPCEVESDSYPMQISAVVSSNRTVQPANAEVRNPLNPQPAVRRLGSLIPTNVSLNKTKRDGHPMHISTLVSSHSTTPHGNSEMRDALNVQPAVRSQEPASGPITDVKSQQQSSSMRNQQAPAALVNATGDAPSPHTAFLNPGIGRPYHRNLRGQPPSRICPLRPQVRMPQSSNRFIFKNPPGHQFSRSHGPPRYDLKRLQAPPVIYRNSPVRGRFCGAAPMRRGSGEALVQFPSPHNLYQMGPRQRLSETRPRGFNGPFPRPSRPQRHSDPYSGVRETCYADFSSENI